MNTPSPRTLCAPTFLVIWLCGWVSQSEAQISIVEAPKSAGDEKPTMEDSWILERDDQTGITVRTMELTLQPKAEPRPALKYRLIPDDFDMRDGNAYVYYLKANGFFEQSLARERLTQIHKGASAQAEKEGKQYHQVPPAVWRSTPPQELPLDEVKEYLRLTSFQPQFIREAAQRDRFDADRNLHEVYDLIGYLLPEIHSMRELARTQSLRCRVALAEGRIEDAIAITGQQFALARHMGHDDFLVSNLVGIAIAGIGWNDALYLVQHPETPNLYWALASMPKPLVDLRHSLAVERQFLYLQLKELREVDETPRPVGYWQDFLGRLLGQFGCLASEFGFGSLHEAPELERTKLVAFVAAAYPGAKEYLIDECNLPRDQVEAYPTAQVVALAAVRFYDQCRDDTFKWTHLPYWQAQASGRRVDDAMRAASKKYGLCTAPAMLLLPAIRAACTAEARCDQTVALLQTVEAIRMYGAAHDGKLPRSLDELPVPAPVEPFTGKPIDYECFGSRAVLSGHSLPGLRYRLVLRLAKQSG
ncbi:MAG: hypothetical protein H8E44_05585 [Planctomycetes bacterium]|nr:hypothetical protein [Planctomycetota bacterium]MBL7037179.1 hypothetical protein [Pirellulaceae bacterium]